MTSGLLFLLIPEAGDIVSAGQDECCQTKVVEPSLGWAERAAIKPNTVLRVGGCEATSDEPGVKLHFC